jgi:hypothetical protein
MKRIIHSFLIAIVALVVSAPRANAATTLDVNITFTIDHVIAVTWAGGYSGTAAAVWAIGTIALDGEYNTLTPTHGTGGSWTNDLRITNATTTGSAVDIDLIIATNSVAGWTAGADSGANTYEIRAKVGDGSETLAELQGGSNITTVNTANFINALAAAGTTNEIDFLFDAPTTISSNAAVAQTIVLRFTASLDD